MKMPFLHEPQSEKSVLDKMGGKARNLHELLIKDFPVPKGFVLFEESDDLEAAVQKIGGFPVAVRSSGALEDLAGASFAGLYETFLFVRSMDELKKAIRDCLASKDSDRVRDYLKTKGIPYTSETLTMSVLVQKMVEAKIAGVLFTMNPINGYEEECYLEFCEGVGERLVSGHVTPSRVRFDWIKEKLILEEINNEGSRISQKQLRELIDYSMKVQAHYGRPQDIEWAIDENGKVHILQSRPVTAYQPREDYPELTNADLKDGGVSARVCTPCMFSSYRDAMQISMGDYLKKIRLLSSDEGVIWCYGAYGRVYWNAEAVKKGLMKIPDFKEEDFDRDLGVQKDYGKKGPHRTTVNLGTIVGAIPVILGLGREFRDCLMMIEEFGPRFERRDREFKAALRRLSSMSDGEFNPWMLEMMRFQQETERNYYRTIYNNSNYQSEFKNLLKRLPAYQDFDEVELMGELHGVAHLDVQSGLARLKALEGEQYFKERDSFLSLHYHHGPAELDITVPRWGENVVWVDELVRDYQEIKASGNSHFQDTVDRLTKNLGYFKRKKFLKMLGESREFLRLREQMRSYSTRGYYLLRQGLLEFGHRHKLLGNRVFMLELKEVVEKLLEPQGPWPDFMKKEILYQGYRNFTPPNEFGGTIEAMKAGTSASGLKGLGCSPGEFTGMARVILDIHQTHDLTKEDILVTLFTDPGWTPVLARVGGVVTEVGGLLSHAAVIGREYGVPAVLNLIDATKLIKDGDMIKINGKTGSVEVVK
jgi:phosphohistidine swiveling domain-containing protein